MEPYEGTAPVEDTTYYEVTPSGASETETMPEGQPYVYETQTGSSTEYGGAVATDQLEGGGEVDLLAAQATFGDNETTYGGSVEGAVGSVEDVPVGPAEVSGEVLSAEGTAYLGEDSSEIGASASIVEGSVELGDAEHSVEVGGSVGVGFGGRVHHSDTDADGVGEYGIGFDAGPISVDAKSEAVGHAANAVGDAAGKVGGAKDAVGGAIGGLFGR